MQKHVDSRGTDRLSFTSSSFPFLETSPVGADGVLVMLRTLLAMFYTLCVGVLHSEKNPSHAGWLKKAWLKSKKPGHPYPVRSHLVSTHSTLERNRSQLP